MATFSCATCLGRHARLARLRSLRCFPGLSADPGGYRLRMRHFSWRLALLCSYADSRPMASRACSMPSQGRSIRRRRAVEAGEDVLPLRRPSAGHSQVRAGLWAPSVWSAWCRGGGTPEGGRRRAARTSPSRTRCPSPRTSSGAAPGGVLGVGVGGSARSVGPLCATAGFPFWGDERGRLGLQVVGALSSTLTA